MVKPGRRYGTSKYQVTKPVPRNLNTNTYKEKVINWGKPFDKAGKARVEEKKKEKMLKG